MTELWERPVGCLHRLSTLSCVHQTSRVPNLAILGLCVTTLFSLAGCHREMIVSKRMTWACESAWRRSPNPEIQFVRFRYVDALAYSELVPGAHLCDQIQSAGKPVVEVQFKIFRSNYYGARGYRILTIDGRPYFPTTGGGSSRVEGASPGPDPFAESLPRHHLSLEQ
jgi:hypothetical protein